MDESRLEFDDVAAPVKNRLDEPIRGPKLGPFEFLRWAWRLLTSMRTAIVLLVLVAVAAIPGSIVPQRLADPNGVATIRDSNPDLYNFYESVQLFDVFTSVWFSAIYVLLFISLIGCILPRIRHHWTVLRSEPTDAPRSWTRLAVRRVVPTAGSTAVALDHAATVLRSARYRVVRDESGVKAEFGYLRETGNLIFHIALVGILATLGFAGGFNWYGQRALVEGQAFTNQLSSFDTFNPGRWFDESQLDPYAVSLNSFVPEYVKDPVKDVWMPIDFTADIAVTENGVERTETLKVNSPVRVGDSQIYLLGNGFAPVITVRNPAGEIVFSQPVPFISQDANLTSVGVVKVPDGLAEQVGMQGFFYPTAVKLDSGALSSNNPEPVKPTVTFNIYKGDLGLDDGSNGNVFQLPINQLTQIAGRHTGVEVVLEPGDTFTLPEGLGSVEFTNVTRYIGVEIRHDATQLGVGLSAAFLVAGLLASLATRRRRVWVRATAKGIEWGAQSRGDDPGLDAAIERILVKFLSTETADKVGRT
ncbi:MAG: cytochrome c biogenesis protein ResB [Microbacteriaceae bacterium]